MADVTAHPLALQVAVLSPKSLNESATDNAQYQSQTLPFLQVLPFLQAAGVIVSQAVVTELNQLLKTPLGTIFDKEWVSAKPSATASAVKFIEQAAASSGVSVSAVSVSTPDQGPVSAFVAPPLTPGGPAQLSLSFQLIGCSISFDALGIDANWLDSFNVTVMLVTPVPLLPFGFAPALTARGSNAVFGPNNASASILKGLDEAGTAIWDWLTNQNKVSEIDLVTQGIEMETDATLPIPINLPLAGVLTDFNAFGPEVVTAGFTQFAFSIENGHTLTGTLTHPLDQGPVVQNGADPGSHGGINLPPELSASQTVVPPGGPFTAAGRYFPWASSGQLYLQWANTSSGKAVSSELIIAENGSSSKTPPIPPGPGFNGDYAYTAAGLTPGVEYTFTARCSDVAAWSLWSEPLKLTTGQTDLVQLILVPPAGYAYPPKQVGAADLANGSDKWACSAVIPASAPPGDYTLDAMLSGQILATMSITVGAVGANIAVIDPSDNQVLVEPPVLVHATFTVRGQAFPDGPIALTIAGNPAATATAVNGSFEAVLTSNEGEYTTGWFTVEAAGGGATATTTYQQIGATK